MMCTSCWRQLGDISAEPPVMETIKNANKSALRVLKERLTQLAH